jgi:hypothetical protein
MILHHVLELSKNSVHSITSIFTDKVLVKPKVFEMTRFRAFIVYHSKDKVIIKSLILQSISSCQTLNNSVVSILNKLHWRSLMFNHLLDLEILQYIVQD